jgi:hypothetical protein
MGGGFFRLLECACLRRVYLKISLNIAPASMMADVDLKL